MPFARASRSTTSFSSRGSSGSRRAASDSRAGGNPIWHAMATSTACGSRAADSTSCSSYANDERERSRGASGILSNDVQRIAPDKLLLSDFAVDSTNIHEALMSDPLLDGWLNEFESDDSYHMKITGYSDCVGSDETNIGLRHGRAQEVESLFSDEAKRRIDFRGMAALGDYVTGNSGEEGRARNRGVVIQFHQEFSFEPMEIEGNPERCGPESTSWLIGEMNRNRNHPVIRNSREIEWPNYIPFFNLGWNLGFLLDFKDLVRAGGPWDYKSNQGMWRSGDGKRCPTQACDRTVMLCNRCFFYDVPGNIHYGWIGRQAGLRPWFLHNRAAAAQAGGVDDPRDTAAINIGIAMADRGASLCGEISKHGDELNTDGTNGCGRCEPA